MAMLYKLYKMVRTFKDGRDDKKANNHWFARAITTETVGSDKIAELIQARCSLTKSDVKGCIEAFIDVIREQIQDSKAVKLDGFGTFKIGLKSTGSESAAEFNVGKNIVGSRVIFFPARSKNVATGKQIISLLNGLKVQETPLNLVTKD